MGDIKRGSISPPRVFINPRNLTTMERGTRITSMGIIKTISIKEKNKFVPG
jgi:hypothetical protein